MRTFIIFLSFGILSLGLQAQKPQNYDQYIEDELIDYSLLLKYKDSINLSNNQVKKLKSFYDGNDFNFEESSRKYAQSMQLLKSAIDNGKSREEVLTIFSDVLALESDIKRNKLGFLLHSREILTDNQRKQLRLIGRSNQLTIKSNGEGYLGNYFSEIKPVFKIVSPNGTEVFVKESLLSKINYSDIQTIDVEKGVDLDIDGFKLLNQNLITIKTSKNISEDNFKLRIRGESSVVDFSMQPLIIINHNGITKIMDNMKLGGNMESINPDEINSIEVIKGEKAIDLYGNKGKSGVIVITLKKESKYKIE